MDVVDLRVFTSTFNEELQRYRPTWGAKVEVGVKRTNAQLWANGYLLRLDLTENHLEPGEAAEGSRKYDQIRMVILRDSREPMDVASWTGAPPKPVATKLWQSCTHGGETRWRQDDGIEITIEQMFSIVRGSFVGAVEAGNR